MKIIERNNFNGVFPMRIKCKRVIDAYGFSYGSENDFCGSVLEIDAEDIKKHSWRKYPDYSGVDYGVKCPVCNQFIVVDKLFIPAGVLDNAEEVSVGH